MDGPKVIPTEENIRTPKTIYIYICNKYVLHLFEVVLKVPPVQYFSTSWVAIKVMISSRNNRIDVH